MACKSGMQLAPSFVLLARDLWMNFNSDEDIGGVVCFGGLRLVILWLE